MPCDRDICSRAYTYNMKCMNTSVPCQIVGLSIYVSVMYVCDSAEWVVVV